jgi:hypothetical protein
MERLTIQINPEEPDDIQREHDASLQDEPTLDQLISEAIAEG